MCTQAKPTRYVKPTTIGLLLLLQTSFWPGTAWSAPLIEVMHWMFRGSDERAMHVLKDEFENRGGTWHEVVGERPVDVLNSAVSRMAKGYAPSFVQWNSTWEVAQIRDHGLVNSIGAEHSNHLKNTLLDNVLDMVTVNNEVVAVPFNVHSENWLWYQTREKIPKSVVKDWFAFLQHARLLKSVDKTALAVGDELWQIRTLFNNVLLGVADQNIFQRIYTDLDETALSEAETAKALRLFTTLRNFSNSFGEGRWDQQVAAVAANRATAVVTGDWAMGEFKKLGLRLGRDYDCIQAPGTSNKIILAIDMFVMGQVESEDEKLGQSMFIDVITDPGVNDTFNYLKGSLPPLKNIDSGELDHCNQAAYKILKKKGNAIMPHANVGDRAFLANLDDLIGKLWHRELTIPEWKERFALALKSEKNKRKKGLRVSNFNQ